jgi:ribosome-associated translation inhibitor RaiA
MQIQIHSDAHVDVPNPRAADIEALVRQNLDRFEASLTRVEVHLTDENSHKGGGDDQRCMIEVRPRGLKPLAVTEQAATLDQAIRGALAKIERALGSTLDKLRDPRR